MISTNRLVVADSLDRISILDLDKLTISVEPSLLRRSSGFNTSPLWEHSIYPVDNPSGYIRKIWKLYPISSDRVYLEHHGGVSSLLSIPQKEIIRKYSTPYRYADRFLYTQSGSKTNIHHLSMNSTVEYLLPESSYYILCHMTDKYLACFDTKYVLLRSEDDTLVPDMTYEVPPIYGIRFIQKVDDFHFLCSTSGNMQFMKDAHPEKAEFFLYHIDTPIPIQHISIPHSEMDRQRVINHHLYCILPSQHLAYYSYPSNTLIVNKVTYTIPLGKVSANWMLPYSNSQVLLSTIVGIYLYNISTNHLDLLHAGNHKMAMAYISAPSADRDKNVNTILPFLTLPKPLIKIICEY